MAGVTPLPRIVVLGGPVPPDLRASLADNLDVIAGDEVSDDTLAAILVHARGDTLHAVRKYRQSGGTTPVFGITPKAPGIEERLAWIREGADDLLAAEGAAEVLVRRIRGEQARVAVDASYTPEPPIGVRVDSYLLALDQYVASRRDLTRRLGDDGTARYLQTVVLRQHVVRAADNLAGPLPPGDRRGSQREPMAWPAKLLEAPDVWSELTNVSPDGFGLILEAEPRVKGILRVEVEGLHVAAEVDLELRWRRRRPDRWETGGWATRARITRST